MVGHQVRLRKVAKKTDSDDRLIPLINVIFLMLIFFLLAGSIRPPDPFDIALPVSASEQVRPSETLVLMVGANGELSMDGSLLDGENAQDLNDALTQRWRLDEEAGNPQLRKIEIQADQALPVARLRMILSAVTGAGADEVSLVTQR
ncbi:MAG: ExbD/TolR family protein [Burkholderiaceae bacterium]